ERRRQTARGGGKAQLRDRGAGLRPQRLVEGDTHALARAAVPNCALGDSVAGILEDKRLCTHLHALGLVGALGHVRALALFGIDWRDRAVLAVDEIDFGNDAEPL